TRWPWAVLLTQVLSVLSRDASPHFADNHSPSFCLFVCLFEGCVLVVSVIEQLAQWHNSTVKAAVERLCNYIPEKLQGFCYVLAELYGPHIAELIDREMNADVVCHSLKLCKQDPGQPLCHLYPPPKVSRFSIFFQNYRLWKVFSAGTEEYRGFQCTCIIWEINVNMLCTDTSRKCLFE
uniref:Saposin B-type domain-containing protein n=1 Tax=Calidris pygmaea TaxID=425635 RepID=A0A8C3JUS7_9CHAR